MSETLEARAEVIKLARVLAVDPDDLAYLDGLPAQELRAFREQATTRIFDSGAAMLGRVGAAARLLPSGVIATIAQRAFGPLLCARAAGTVDPDKALDVAGRLPADFLADVTVELDPRRVAAIIADVPEALVIPVAAELGRRGEHVTMGRFLAFVPDHAIAAAIATLDDETMLRTAFVLEHKDRLDHAIGLLPPERLPGILREASVLALWPEALDLLDHLSEERRGPIADLVAAQDPAHVAALVEAVDEAGLWDSLLPIVRLMNPEARVALAAVPAFHPPEVLSGIVRAAAAQGLWVDLVPLLDALPAEVRAIVPGVAAGLDAELLGNVLAEAVRVPHTFATLLQIVDGMDDGARARVVSVIERADVTVARDLLDRLTDPEQITILIALLSDDLLAAVRVAAARHGLTAELEAALGAARAPRA